MMDTYLHMRSAVLSRLSQHTRQTPEHVADSNAVRTRALLNLAVAFLQSFCCGTKHTICHALCCVAVLLDLVYAVCEKVDVGFQRLTELAEMQL
jgi:hypothetical protein